MEIKFFSYIRYFTGEKQIVWNSSANELADLLEQLSLKYGDKFRNAVLKPDKTALNPMIMILVNGHHVKDLNGLHTKLAPADKISILPTAIGG